MLKIEKTVFLSYRRTNIGYALAVYQNLTSRGFDVFFDYESIQAGDFEQIILNNIASRAHFVVLLTPSALERLSESGDWLRREIEYAMEIKRNIVPLTLDKFEWSVAKKHLTGKLEHLQSYNALEVPRAYFPEAMNRLCEKRLNIPLDAVIHPRTAVAEQAAKKAKQEAEAQPTVSTEAVENELTAEEWFKRGLALDDNSQEEIDCYTKAIALKPDYAVAYYTRGVARDEQGDVSGAIADYDKAIALKPDYAYAYNNRGNARQAQEDISGSLADYDKAIVLKPDLAEAYYNRGVARQRQGDVEGAIADYDKVIALKPDLADAYNNRGVARKAQGDVSGAIADYDKAIALKPDYAEAYIRRGNARDEQGDVSGAIADYDKAIALKPDYADVYNNKAWALHLQDKNIEALAYVSKALDLQPDNSYILHTRGAVHLALGHINSAIRDFEKALKIKPDSQEVIEDLAKARAKLKS